MIAVVGTLWVRLFEARLRSGPGGKPAASRRVLCMDLCRLASQSCLKRAATIECELFPMRLDGKALSLASFVERRRDNRVFPPTGLFRRAFVMNRALFISDNRVQLHFSLVRVRAPLLGSSFCLREKYFRAPRVGQGHLPRSRASRSLVNL